MNGILHIKYSSEMFPEDSEHSITDGQFFDIQRVISGNVGIFDQKDIFDANRASECVNALAGIKDPKLFVEIGKVIIADNNLTEDKLTNIRKVLEGKMNWKSYSYLSQKFESSIGEELRVLENDSPLDQPEPERPRFTDDPEKTFADDILRQKADLLDAYVYEWIRVADKGAKEQDEFSKKMDELRQHEVHKQLLHGHYLIQQQIAQREDLSNENTEEK